MISLNPCAKCGRIPKLRFAGILYCVFGGYESMNCPNCGMNGTGTVARATKYDAAKQWNAANPKEGKPNE